MEFFFGGGILILILIFWNFFSTFVFRFFILYFILFLISFFFSSVPHANCVTPILYLHCKSNECTPTICRLHRAINATVRKAVINPSLRFFSCQCRSFSFFLFFFLIARRVSRPPPLVNFPSIFRSQLLITKEGFQLYWNSFINVSRSLYPQKEKRKNYLFFGVQKR